jgi:hypothetical protein
MTTRIRTQQVPATAYYLGRPASFWLTALAPRPATRTSSCAQDQPARTKAAGLVRAC